MKQAIILFTENLSRGFSKPRTKKISMYIDMRRQSLDVSDLLSKRDSASFKSCGHKKFQKLRELLELWEAMGIESTICKRFHDLQEWDAWRKTVGFRDYEVHWQVFTQHEDGSWTLYLEQGLGFPPALEQIYRLAASMKPNPVSGQN